MDNATSRSRAGARALEDKVAMVAAKKCSVEEVTRLHKELQDWLHSEVDKVRSPRPHCFYSCPHKFVQTSSLWLSAALLRAILTNHVAHSEAIKVAKITEANLKAKLDDLGMTNSKIETELRRSVPILSLHRTNELTRRFSLRHVSLLFQTRFLLPKSDHLPPAIRSISQGARYA
jgi:hypothetical protein